MCDFTYIEVANIKQYKKMKNVDITILISRIAVVGFYITIKHKIKFDMCDLTYMSCVKKHTIKFEEVRMKLYNTDFEEQETIVHIDYARSQIHLYSCRKTVIKKLKGKLGEPNKTYTIRDQVSGASWTLSFEDKRKITSVLSRPTLIGSVK